MVNFAASSSSLKKGETLIDTVNNILAMKVDMVVMRHPYPGAAKFLSEHVNSKIINAGDGSHEHPTQALLDAYSIREKLGSVRGKKLLLLEIFLILALPYQISFVCRNWEQRLWYVVQQH